MRRGGNYEVTKRLRDLVVFARHNVITDPPFSRIDLICCRNLLIYIEPETQRKILGMFNFALRDGGTLFLGSAETIGMHTDLFEPISAPWRLFRSRRAAHAGRFDFPRATVTDQRRGVLSSENQRQPVTDRYLSLAQRALLERYAPPSLVIDANHQVLVYDVGQLRPDLAEAPQIPKPFDPEALEPTLLQVFLDRGQAGKSASSRSPRRPPPAAKGVPKSPMKSRGEIEAAVCQGMCQFEQEYLGRGPRDVRAHLIGDLLVVRLYGVLTAAEQHLIESCSAEQGRDLLKRVRSLLIETARLQIDLMIQIITGVKVRSMHHDISTVTGEELVIFTLSKAPCTREPKKR